MKIYWRVKNILEEFQIGNASWRLNNWQDNIFIRHGCVWNFKYKQDFEKRRRTIV